MNKIDKLIQYLDGELSASEVADVETELKQDKAYQAQLAALNRVELLLGESSLVTPASNFASRFEQRLDQRLKRRRNMLGAAIIGLVVVLAAGLLVWTLADAGTALLGLVNGVNLVGYAVDLLQSVFTVAGMIIRVVTMVSEATFQIIQHPVFWGYALVVIGLVSLWAQLLRWVGVVQPSAA